MPTIPGPAAPPATDLPPCGLWCSAADLRCMPDPPLTDEIANLMISTSSSVLYELTKRRWPGVCTTTVRPCAQQSTGIAPRWWGGSRVPWPVPNGMWFGNPSMYGAWGYCGCDRSRRCGCSMLSEIDLKNDVVDVITVKVNGDVVDPSLWDLSAGRYLIATPDAEGNRRRWPCCQRLDLPDTEDGTWSIQYRFGAVPPDAGRMFAAELACELAKGLKFIDADCRLPKLVTSVTRQGVSQTMTSIIDVFKAGITGLPEVDLWIGSMNRGVDKRPGAFIVPGRHSRAQRQ